MVIPLEDSFNDIIGKAQRGLSLNDSQLAERAGVSAEAVGEILNGKLNEAHLRKIAPILSLNTDALLALAHKKWYPKEQEEIQGLRCYNTVYEDMTVNSYLVWDIATRSGIAFDTGTDVTTLLEDLREYGITLKAIFITHTHGDHIFDLDRLVEKTKAPVYVGCGEPHLEGANTFSAGESWTFGGLQVGSRLTRGHAPGGITYVVHGLPKTLAITGDAMFAGSMGGGIISYAEALKTSRDAILSLAEDVVICPGHGPLTTVGEEKQNNPFFA